MKISAVMSVFNAMDYLPYSIRSIYDFVDEIIICDGLIAQFNIDGSVKSDDGLSNDGTIEFIKSFSDKEKKIKYSSSKTWGWEKDKRQHIVGRATGDWIMTVDSDEIYKEEDLLYVKNVMQKNPEIWSIWPIHYRFCGDFNHYYPWLGAVFQRKFKGCELFGLREMWFPGKKVYKYPWSLCKNVSEEEFKKHVWNPTDREIICYHYSNVCTEDKAHRKKLISVGLNHKMQGWEEKQFGLGLSQEKYEKILNTKRFKGTHPSVMIKHPYMINPPNWMGRK